MSAQVHVLVEFKDGKPYLTLGAGLTAKLVRAYTRPGSADNYREAIIADAKRIDLSPDIRVLTVLIPDEGPVKDGFWPNLIPVTAVTWS